MEDKIFIRNREGCISAHVLARSSRSNELNIHGNLARNRKASGFTTLAKEKRLSDCLQPLKFCLHNDLGGAGSQAGGQINDLIGETLFSSVPPGNSLVSVSDPLRAVNLPGALLLELQRIKDTFRCAAPSAMVPGHRQ